MNDMQSSLPPLLTFSDVGKSYQALNGIAYQAIRGFNLDITEGDFFCLLGPTGCGKTTILSMLAGFEMPTSGSIRLAGETIQGTSADRGVVFQSHDSLYPWLTALENVEFGLRMRGVDKATRRERAIQQLRIVGLAGQEKKHPQELSGGMKQRIQIARVLANRPKILLMDEPFAALDAQTRNLMQQELRRIWLEDRVSVLFITHYRQVHAMIRDEVDKSRRHELSQSAGA
jgi:ABC-type nitrate/sulfonate/bicarbonate transport system ATPase subunit